ncbi:helix-turn-helix transcriptional regulator [Nocardia sp. NPDC052001]|uniref:helix-turn-helix domain-containing protein n=1 Tax=Nocardia sp. NPDC052001 TaxID=3154853 RepID=UPI0034398EA0
MFDDVPSRSMPFVVREQVKALTAVIALQLSLSRELAGLDVSEAAIQIGVTVPRLLEFEAGRQSPTWVQMYRLCNVYGVDARDLLATSRTAMP